MVPFRLKLLLLAYGDRLTELLGNCCCNELNIGTEISYGILYFGEEHAEELLPSVDHVYVSIAKSFMQSQLEIGSVFGVDHRMYIEGKGYGCVT